MAQQTVTLQPGESKTVAFEATPTTAKTYQISVNGLTGSFSAVAAPTPPFTMEIISATHMNDKYSAPSPTGLVFQVCQIKVRITNNTSVVLTHRLRCLGTWGEYYRYQKPITWQFTRYWSNNATEITVTLQPGQSVELLSPYYYIDGWHQTHQNYEWLNLPAVGYVSGVLHEVWFIVVDENNNASPAVSIGSALSY